VTDPRPRPQYGEYATPEEQAKAMGIPAPADPAADGVSLRKDGAGTSEGSAASGNATSTSASTSATSTSPSSRSTSMPPAQYGEGSAPIVTTPAVSATPVAPAAAATRPRRIWDSVLTAVLLGIGIVSVTSSIPQYADSPSPSWRPPSASCSTSRRLFCMSPVLPSLC
jgi:hypothetical protein